MSDTARKAEGEGRPMPGPRSDRLAAQMEPFDSFWEGPDDVEKGYDSFKAFYRANYLKHVTPNKNAEILVISCGPGYFINVLNQVGYFNVVGIDSFADKIEHARYHGLNCVQARAFEYIEAQDDASFELIFCEQELNHLTKDEMIEFLRLAHSKLKENGQLICHGLNGANPIVGAETLAQNWDHQNTFTSYSLNQVLEHTGFDVQKIFGLHLYVFYKNPANYVAWGITAAFHLIFQILFKIYGKSNKIFEKKIAAVAVKRADASAGQHLRSI
jgi:2-polyprenyl-3-methyl-5-hydroxy-6-metoxy-1,4-benzoquinol methylase